MKLDILAFGAHPDDVELGCGGTLSKAVAEGKKVGIIDLTQGEKSTRGNIETRREESLAAKNILGVDIRENINFKDAFIFNDESHQTKVIHVIRKYAPDVVLCNAVKDRHPDHGKASELLSQSCFLSGLQRIETKDEEGNKQAAFRPKHIFHYIQWEDLKPDFVVDITGFLNQKMEAVRAFKSQFYDENARAPQTPISSLNYIESVASRAKNMGRLIYKDAAEGFTTERLLALENFDSLL
ncbi:MAG: bacillithiol biosynthesis deacetylase BshB1 [Flavobacteriaceae bacterium TMED171]|nr:bacillithiol biosynthesis deacetylase BshB1 [Flavobacteriaceae bacterium]OUW31362.1 MAG: bacillithiol biosynthesis deacetylase BshB1 [Flavobacteriaceae bacterium TMED171]|tara:strand:+ start:1347 stop:2066 length:720 start_codon:yes stop_codon:yes gene_type:complete